MKLFLLALALIFVTRSGRYTTAKFHNGQRTRLKADASTGHISQYLPDLVTKMNDFLLLTWTYLDDDDAAAASTLNHNGQRTRLKADASTGHISQGASTLA
jgi:hypothetical protein